MVGDTLRKDGPPKLGKGDSHKKRFDLAELKDKAINRHEKSETTSKGSPAKLGKSDQGGFKLNFDGLRDNLNRIDKKRFIIIIIAFIILIVLGVFASSNSHQTSPNQTNNSTNLTPVTGNHFNNGKISFDYPLEWNASSETTAPIIVTIGEDEYNSFSVLSENMGSTSFAERILQWRQNILQSGQITSEGNITIDNTRGYEIEAIYKVNNTTYNTRGVAIAKNNTVYFIMFIFNKSLLDYKDEMDQVINSFHVK